MGKITKIFPIFCIFFAKALDVCLGEENDELQFDKYNISATELIQSFGYPVEVHKIQTEDGYILELHRIPHGKFSNSRSGVPILLVHGLLASSVEFLLLESNSLAFILADAGCDVWMLNMRGSTYSMSHKTMQASDPNFWDFSWHEQGVYDIPSAIDYVCKYTQRDQLLFVGYSMGTTAFFVTASMRPEYQEKLQGAILIGPTAYIKYTRTPLRALAPFSKTIKSMYDFIGKQGILERTPEVQTLMKTLCKPEFLCKNFLFMIAGRDSQGFQNKVLPTAVMHMPAGTSVKTAAHYGQLIMSGKFQQYDYGVLRNLKIYHQGRPPIYNLEAITIPLSLFVAPNDVFVTRRDLVRLFNRLHSVKNLHIIPNPKFTHIDFVVSRNVSELFYPELLKEVQDLTSYGTVKPVQKRSKAQQQKTVPNINYHQDHHKRVHKTRVDKDKTSHNPAHQIKHAYNIDPVDYNTFNQNDIPYNEAEQDKNIFIDGQPVQDEVVYNEDDYTQAVDQNKIVYNADYNTVNHNGIVYNRARQHKNVYNRAKQHKHVYNGAKQHKHVYNGARQHKNVYGELDYNLVNPNKVVYNDDHYNQPIRNKVVYNEDDYSQAMDQKKMVYNSDYSTLNHNEIVYNEGEQDENVYNEGEQDENVYNEGEQDENAYNEANQDNVMYNEENPDEVVYNEDQYNQAIDQDKVLYDADYNPATYNSVSQNEIFCNEAGQNEAFYKEIDYIPVKYKKANHLPLNYKNVDYSGAQYSDF